MCSCYSAITQASLKCTGAAVPWRLFAGWRHLAICVDQHVEAHHPDRPEAALPKAAGKCTVPMPC